MAADGGMAPDDRGSHVVWGQHRGLVFTGEVSHTRNAQGREHREETYVTFDKNPYRLLDREGTRNRQFPRLRLSENRMDTGALGKTKVVKVYDDTWAYQQMNFSRFPRGLVETGFSLQSGSFTILMNGARSGIWVAGGEFTATIHFRAPTKTYRYYSGLPASETRSAGAPPSVGQCEILKVDLGQEGAVLARVGFNLGSVCPPFQWYKVGGRCVESGGYWVIEEQWSMLMRLGYVCIFSGSNGGRATGDEYSDLVGA